MGKRSLGLIALALAAVAGVAVYVKWRSGPLAIKVDVDRKDPGRANDRIAIVVVTEPDARVEVLGHSADVDAAGRAQFEVPIDSVPLGLSKLQVSASRTGFLHFGGDTTTVDIVRGPQPAVFETQLDGSKLVVTTLPTNTVVVKGKSYTPDARGAVTVSLAAMDFILDADLTAVPDLLDRDAFPLTVTVHSRDGEQASDTLSYTADNQLLTIGRSVLDVSKSPLAWAAEATKTKPVPALEVSCQVDEHAHRECGKPRPINGLTRLRDVAYIVYETPSTIVASKCGPYVRKETADLQRQFGDLGSMPGMPQPGVYIERIQHVVTLQAYAARTGKLVVTRTIAGPAPRTCGGSEMFDSVVATIETGTTSVEGGEVDPKAVAAAIAAL